MRENFTIPQASKLSESVSYIALQAYFRESARKLLYGNNTSGYRYFTELISALSTMTHPKEFTYTAGSEDILNHEDNVFRLAEEVSTKIQNEAGYLSPLEARNLLVILDKKLMILGGIQNFLRTKYSFIQSVLLRRLGNLMTNIETQQKDPTNGEIIDLTLALKPAHKRGELAKIEDLRPSLTIKIEEYKKRVNGGLHHLGGEDFIIVHDILLTLTYSILEGRTRVLSQDEIDKLVVSVGKLSRFECSYLITALENILEQKSTGSEDSKKRLAPLINIFNCLKSRKNEVQLKAG